MNRKNYRILSYYENDCYSKEVYIFIINARSEASIKTYMNNTGLYWEIIDVDECCSLSDVMRADSILIEGERFYKVNDTRYDSALKLIGEIYSGGYYE